MVNAIARVRYFCNQKQDGTPSTTPVQKSMFYYGYGTPDKSRGKETRGVWYDQNGAVRSYGAALAWAKGTALRNKYTFTLLLSVKDVRLAPEAFVAAMQHSTPPFTQWRLIAHDDTDYAHAHVIAFSNKPIPKRMIVGWSSRAREALETLRLEQMQRPVQFADQDSGSASLSIEQALASTAVEYDIVAD